MNINFPEKTYINRILPKKLFYDRVVFTSSIKEDFTKLIERIVWLNKLSFDTIGIPKTNEVEEIQLFQLELKEKVVPESVIKTISKCIPYKILFLLKYNDDFKYVILYENKIYHKEWNENIDIDFNVLNLENLYQNIIKSLLNLNESSIDFNELIEKQKYIEELKKKIESLERKVKSEKQFNRKVELNMELNKTKKELEEILNG